MLNVSLLKLFASLLLFLMVLMTGENVHAFTDTNADTLYNAYNAAFYATFATGKSHYLLNKSGGVTYFWGQAEQIEGAIDAYDRTKNSIYQTNITQLLNGFSSDNGTSWSGNIYNDDIMWACIAYLRGYQATGNAVFRAIAKANFDLVYARGWDTVLGGGLYWSTAKAQKNACVNGPAAIVACLLYRALNDATYLTKAQNIYNWEKAVLFNPTNGAVYDNITTGGTLSTWSSTYNQGTFVGAADLLGDTTNAMLAATYTMNNLGNPGPGGYPLLFDYGTDNNNSGFNGIGIRWIAKFMSDRNFQFLYLRWLQANAEAAWNVRRNADNLSWCQWDQATPAVSNLLAWDCISSMVALQVVPASSNAAAPVFVVQPTSQITAAGNAVCLSAFATNGPGVSYQWYHENNTITGGTSSNLTLISVRATDAGNYWVIASNAVAQAYSQAAQIVLFGVTNGVLAQDSATNYSSFSGNQGVGFGAWTLSTVGGGTYISGDKPPLFGLWNSAAGSQSTATRAFNIPLRVGATLTMQLQMGTLDTAANQNGFALVDGNGNWLFSYWHQGGDNANGHYVDASGTNTASGFAYDFGKLDAFRFTLSSATNYTFTDVTTGRSVSGRLGGGPIAGIMFYRVNTASAPSNGQDFKFTNLAITVVPEIPTAAPLTLSMMPMGRAMNFAVAPGYVYRVLQATNISGPWSTIGTLVGPETGESLFIDTNAAAGQSFYRTITP